MTLMRIMDVADRRIVLSEDFAEHEELSTRKGTIGFP